MEIILKITACQCNNFINTFFKNESHYKTATTHEVRTIRIVTFVYTGFVIEDFY